MDEQDVIGLFYNREDNVFIDEDGRVVWDIFDFITPNDLFLFRQKRNYIVVRHRTLPGVVCELHWPKMEIFHDVYYNHIDVGDDYERIERYEKAKLFGCFI